MMQLIWSPRAQLDLALIDGELFLEDPDFADRVALAAVYSARFLLEWPYAGSTVGGDGRRKWPVKKTPYILVYKVMDESVHILRVYHERQDWGAVP